MDCVEELRVSTELMQALSIVLPAQYIIDNDLTEASVNNEYGYFGRKWSKTNHVLVNTWGSFADYKYGKLVTHFLCGNNVILHMIDGVNYSMINGIVNMVTYDGITVHYDDPQYCEVRVACTDTFGPFKLKTIEIRDNAISMDYSKSRIVDIDGEEYVLPWEVGVAEDGYTPLKGNAPMFWPGRDNDEIFWDFGDHYYCHAVGCLPKVRKDIKCYEAYRDTVKKEIPLEPQHIKELQRVENMINAQYPRDKVIEFITVVKAILPPVILENVLFNPKIYTNCIPEILNLVNVFFQI